MSLRSSGTCCAVRGCTNNQTRLNIWLREQCYEHAPKTKRDCPCDKRYRFHRLPTDEDAKRTWLKNLNLEKPPKYLFVCSFHFVDKKPTKENPHPTLWLGSDRPPEERRHVDERTSSASIEPDMSVLIHSRGEAGGGVAAHLQCLLCGHLSRSHAQQLFHIAASHPTSLDGVAVGRLGNMVMYQSTAQLFHCFDCFFTSRDFTKLYKHIISKHCMDEKDGEGGDGSEKGEKTREEGEKEVGEVAIKEEEEEEGGQVAIKEEEEEGGQVAIKEEEGEGHEDGASQRAESARADDPRDENGMFESGSYCCLLCGWKSKAKSQAVSHVTRKHDIHKTYAAQAIKRYTVKSRQTQSGGLEEEETGLSGETLKEEIEATAKVIRFISNRFVCLMCGWKSKLKGFAISHVVSCHDVERPYTCKVCQSSFFLPSRLQQHISTAHRPGRYACPFCCFRSQFLGGFRRHCSRCNAREGREGEEQERGGEGVEVEEEKRVARKRRTVRVIKEEEEEREEEDDDDE